MSNQMNVLTEKQSLSVINIINADISVNQIVDPTSQFITCTDVRFNDDDLLNALSEDISSDLFNPNQFTMATPNLNEILSMNNKQRTSNTLEAMPNPPLNCFVLHTGTASSSHSTIDNAILPRNFLFDQYQSNQNVVIQSNATDQSKSVVPVVSTSDRSANLPYNNPNMQSGLLESNKIQIKCQPREKFRPRTENESKISSHYLRCEESAVHDHPTVYVPQSWLRHSDTNIIEVALVDINKHPHLYTIGNKAALIPVDNFDNTELIFKRNESNVLYFRLTNDDFLAGFKTFMIELIKNKQDETITKKVIRSRKLNQSMLCFTRIYRDQYGHLYRDLNSQEYSCVMTESYGDVSVEHIGPRFGPVNGQEMMFILFKGRFVKQDLSFTIVEPTSGWSQSIEKFMVNGSLVYFTMPNFPNPQASRAAVLIGAYFKQQKIHESTYLYLDLLDQLVNMSSDISFISNNMQQLEFDVLPVVQKATRSKPTKRLNSK